jgi:methylase of polypeptide subunit release factors
MDKVFKTLGASNHCLNEREAVDYYTTDPDCVKDLLKVEKFSKTVLEPCCGCGNIAHELELAGYNVIATDLYDHGYGKVGVDFFTDYISIDCDVITNPPYMLGTEFVKHALDIMKPGTKMALFLKLQFLEGQERLTNIYAQNHLKKVYIYSKRVACFKNNEMWQRNDDGSYKLDKAGNKQKVNSAVCYAWYIFEKDYAGKPTIDWIS